MYDCAVPGCKAKGVHNFPRNEQFRKLWEIAAKTSESKIYNPTKTCKICATHFKPDDYFKEGFYTGVKNKKRVLKKNVIPSRFPWNTKKKSLLRKMGLEVEKKEKSTDTVTTEPKSDEKIADSVDPQNQDKNIEKMDEDVAPTNSVITQNQDKETEKMEEVNISAVSQNQDNNIETTVDMAATVSAVFQNQDTTYKIDEASPTISAVPQTDKIDEASPTISAVPQTEEVKITETQILQAIQAETKLDKTELRLTRQKNKQKLALEHYKNDNLQVLAHTGIQSFEKLLAVFEALGTEVYFLESRRNVISAEDQFFLTLIKLRQNKEDDELAKLFSITPAVATDIFITWINFLYEKWKVIKLSPENVEILVSPHDYLSQSDRPTDGQSKTSSTDEKGGKNTKAKAKKKIAKKSDQDSNKLTVPDTIPEGISKTYTILQSTQNIKHVSRPKLYLVCKILCCYIDNTINPFIYRMPDRNLV